MIKKQLMTQEDYDALQARLKELNLELDVVLQAIKDARSQGDLSENADYKAARERQGELQKEINDVSSAIKYAEIIVNFEEVGNLKRTITVEYLIGLEPNEEKVYKFVLETILGANPLEDKISVESPLGKAIQFAHTGEIKNFRTENGDRFEVKVLDIR